MIIYMQDTIAYLASLKTLPKPGNDKVTVVKELNGVQYFKIIDKK